jgi:hypothetical protein
MIKGVLKYISGFTLQFFKCMAVILPALLAVNNVYSQDYYSTRKGQIIVQSVFYDSVLFIKSNDLIMRLDYGKANLKMSVNLNSFSSTVDTVNAKLKELTNKSISFTGKLGLDYINTKPHLPQYFDFQGTVSYNDINEAVSGKGSLTHISSNGVITSCVLWLEFKLDTEKFSWELARYGFSDVITINIIQAILDQS